MGGRREGRLGPWLPCKSHKPANFNAGTTILTRREAGPKIEISRRCRVHAFSGGCNIGIFEASEAKDDTDADAVGLA
jgi:hypothetical protein